MGCSRCRRVGSRNYPGESMCEGRGPRLREMLTCRAVALVGTWELGLTFRAAVHGGHGFIQGSPECRMPSERATTWME